MKIKRITKKTYSQGKNAYCVSVDNPEHEVLVVGKSGLAYRCGQSVNFGLLYGRSAYGMAKGMGMTPKEAESFIDKYFAKFKSLKILIEQSKNTLRNKGYARTILGRRRRFPDYQKALRTGDRKLIGEMERQALNTLVQGSAADLIKVQMIKLHEKLKPYKSRILLTIHDELLVECPEEFEKEVLELVLSVMENGFKLGDIPLKAEAHTSKRWKK